jgi:hypothetical protein
MENLEPYKSLRTTIFEVQATAKPTNPAEKKPSAQTGHKAGDTWKTASGKIGAKNKDGAVDYFEDEDSAKAWISGQFKPAGRSDQPGDTSVPVELDRDGYEVKKTAGGSPANAKPTAAAATRPAPQPAGGAAPKAQATAANTQRQAQPQGSQKGAEQKPVQAQQQPAEDPEVKSVAGEDPQSSFDSQGQGDTGKDNAGFKKTGKKAKFKTEEDKAKSIRKSKLIASAIKSGKMTGPKDDSESLTGNAEAERAYVAELNHAALQSGMGGDVIDHEPCSKMFAALGFCYDNEGKQKDKGIKRPEMPQLSGIVDTERTDSVAYKEALKQAKRLRAAKDKFKTDDPTKEQKKDITDEEVEAANPSPEEIGSVEVNFEEKFIEALKNSGYEVDDVEVNPSTLRPIQTEMQGSKIAGMYSTIAAAEVDPKTYGSEAVRLKAPIFTSGGYVIDGHHRWAAMIGADMANGRGADMRMKTRNIKKGGKDVDIDEMVAFSNAFQHAMGITNQDRNSKPTRKNFSDAELKTSEQIAKGLGIKENKPQTKPQQQKEWTMSKFGSGRFGRIVQSLHESAQSRVELEEAAKKKFDKTPALGTFRSGMQVDTDDPQYYAGALKSKPRKTDAAGNMLKTQKQKEKASAGWAKTQATVQSNIATAQDLIDTAEIKPVGTTFEIYGKKGGKEATVKVKKVMKMGDVVYMVGTTEVELYAAGTGLQVLNKKTRKAVLDAGNDMIWESADFTDVGRIYISEIRKLSDAELAKADAERRKKVMAAKDAAINKRAAEGKAAWKK